MVPRGDRRDWTHRQPGSRPGGRVMRDERTSGSLGRLRSGGWRRGQRQRTGQLEFLPLPSRIVLVWELADGGCAEDPSLAGEFRNVRSPCSRPDDARFRPGAPGEGLSAGSAYAFRPPCRTAVHLFGRFCCTRFDLSRRRTVRLRRLQSRSRPVEADDSQPCGLTPSQISPLRPGLRARSDSRASISSHWFGTTAACALRRSGSGSSGLAA